MRILVFSILLSGLMMSCAKTTSTEKAILTVLSGDMLFSGPNSLQASIDISATALAEDLNISASSLKSVDVSGIHISLNEQQASLAESLLLQVVSDNNEMTALGTLSPLNSGMDFDLKVAEEVDILPFLQDQGATWVLDINLSDDVMDRMEATAEILLTLNYKSE